MYLHISYILKLQNGISDLNVSAGFKITLCGHNINYGKTKQSAIWQLELQNWTGNEIFRKVNEKGEEKKQQKKIARVWPGKVYPFGNGSYNIEKDTKLQRENEI